MTDTTAPRQADRHGNAVALEGCDRCPRCGCKYWEADKCIDCGSAAAVVLDLPLDDSAHLAQRAEDEEYLHCTTGRGHDVVTDVYEDDVRGRTSTSTYCGTCGVEIVHEALLEALWSA